MSAEPYESIFATVENTWSRSARRGWTTLASFTMQILALSLLLALPMIWVQRMPLLSLRPLTSPAAFTPRGETPATAERHQGHSANMTRKPQIISPQIVAPQSIPRTIERITDLSQDSGIGAPELPGTPSARGSGLGDAVIHGLGNNLPIVIPQRPAAVKPLLVSHLAEANLLHRVQPIYPALARQARVQGTVELRAIISKTGTIENLVVVRGHPMLSVAAVDAVRQWRYRPYLLNGEPVEVETQITVNFTLSGN